MPELPDVEVYRRYLEAHALGRELSGVSVSAPEILEEVTPRTLRERLTGHAFASARRHGKYLFARLDAGGAVVLHFGMTGELAWRAEGGEPPEHTRVLFEFTRGAWLAYVNQRKLGMVGWTDDIDAFIADRDLGPDARGLSADDFRALAADRRGMVKGWLMDQSAMAGIGNEYSDEILFQAGIHPRMQVADLDADRLETLHRAMVRVLDAAVEADVDVERMPADFLLPRRHEGGECPRCGTPLASLRTAGRTAWICPRCQPEP